MEQVNEAVGRQHGSVAARNVGDIRMGHYSTRLLYARSVHKRGAFLLAEILAKCLGHHRSDVLGGIFQS